MGELLDRGMANRAAVLGAEHVAKSLASASEFARPLQELVTEYCWGAIWGRQGLDFRTRSLLNVAMLAALNRQHELAIHVQGAIRNGCSVTEVQEAILQTAVYCGVPAALEASRTAQSALATAGALTSAGATVTTSNRESATSK